MGRFIHKWISLEAIHCQFLWFWSFVSSPDFSRGRGDVCTQAINHLAEKKSPVVRAIQTKCDRVKKSKLIFLLKPSNSESISFVLTWEQKESIPVLQLKIWNIFFTVPIDKYFQTIPMRYFLKSLSSTPRTLWLVIESNPCIKWFQVSSGPFALQSVET